MTNGTTAGAIASSIINSPIFPPSFDGSPWLFSWAVAARLLLLMLSSAMIVRLTSRARIDVLPWDHPALYGRMLLILLMATVVLDSLSDVLTWLAWGEVELDTMRWILSTGRVLDGMSVVPFVMALYIPPWMLVLRYPGVAKTYPEAKGFLAGGMFWADFKLPVSLAVWCVVAAVGVTFTKWSYWDAGI